ncbi:hypothetical protein TNCV_3106511 [Trichonephila clavipes]|nr:hypothetical protein TNCV_3106511 [Trichonephila clavipes]
MWSSRFAGSLAPAFATSFVTTTSYGGVAVCQDLNFREILVLLVLTTHDSYYLRSEDRSVVRISSLNFDDAAK